MSQTPQLPRAVVAARLLQARTLRDLSQREVGVRMGLDKDTASARISRYESEAMTISLEALFQLAEALEITPAFLLAPTPALASAILALSELTEPQQRRWAEVIEAVNDLPANQRKALIDQLLAQANGAR